MELRARGRTTAGGATGVAWSAVVSTAVLCLTGCSDPTGPTLADLAGTWDATVVMLTNAADPAETQDAIARGLEFRLIMGADGSAEAHITVDGETDVEVGTVAISGEEITVVLDGSPSSGTFRLDGDRLTLELRSGVEWDFEGNGLDVPAFLSMTLVREGS